MVLPVKNPTTKTGDTGDMGLIAVRKTHWSRKWSPTLVFLPRKLHGQEALGGYSAWDHKELDTSEHACTSKTMTSEELKQFLSSLYKYQCIIMK